MVNELIKRLIAVSSNRFVAHATLEILVNSRPYLFEPFLVNRLRLSLISTLSPSQRGSIIDGSTATNLLEPGCNIGKQTDVVYTDFLKRLIGFITNSFYINWIVLVFLLNRLRGLNLI